MWEKGVAVLYAICEFNKSFEESVFHIETTSVARFLIVYTDEE